MANTGWTLTENASLLALNTFHVQAQAAQLLEIQDSANLPDALALLSQRQPAGERPHLQQQPQLLGSLYGDFVYLVQPKADAPADATTPALEVRQVFVKTGRRTGGLVEVSGIDPGAQVVSAGQNRLSNSQPAIVNNDVNPAAAATGPAVTGASE